MSSEKSLSGTDGDLPQEYLSLLEKQVHRREAKVSFLSLYRFATPLETVFIGLGLFMAVVHGVALPMFAFVLGSLTDDFKDFVTGSLDQSGEFMKSIQKNALYFVYIGIGIIFSSLFEAAILVRTGEMMADRYRKAFLRATLAQNIGYFDDLGTGEITTKLINDTTAVQDAISEKFGKTIAGVATFIASLVVAFVTQWKLTFILLGGSVWIILVMTITGVFITKYVLKSEAAYAQGSSIVEDTISSIRNTFAFGLQDTMAKSFGLVLDRSRAFNNHKNQAMAAMFSLLYASFFWLYALTFWQGSRMIIRGELSIGQIFAVMEAVFLGSYIFGQIAPNFQFIAKGLAACASLNQTIDREPAIESSKSGLVLDVVDGLIEFKKVVFRYPSRPDVPVLSNFSLKIHQGETVALVGPSGSGKSTIVGLLERFYSPLDGQISLDGTPIEGLNLRWLRQQIGLVSQEPTLFPTSIYENIAYGLIGSKWEHESDEVKRELVIEACKQANAWDFIKILSLGLETPVGDRGALLSGGQKQRIAIARAIVSNPKILLLDEATSALDTKSEGVVQEALDRAAKTRTTIVVAHRLSTIRNADNIVVMSKGDIIEQGTHNDLIKARGEYFNFVEAQNIKNSLHLDSLPDEKATTELKEAAEVLTREISGLDRKSSQAITEATGKSSVEQGTHKPPSFKKTIRILWLLNKPERTYILLGMLSAIFLGIGFPAAAVILGKICQSIMVPESQYPDMRREINMLTGVLFAGGWEQALASLMMILLLSHAGEGLLKRVRLTLFERYLRMDASFFDDEKHSAGALTAVIARDGKAVEGLGGSVLGQILNSIVMVIAGVIIGIAFNWRLGLVGFACVPVLVGSGYMRVQILQILTDQRQDVYEASGSLAAQYATAVRTVQTLTLESSVQAKYNQILDGQARKSLFFIIRSSGIYGFTEGVTPLIMALVFWYGGKLLHEGKIGIMAFFVVFIGIVQCSEGAGNVFTYAPDMAKARNSAANVVRALEAKPIVDTKSNDGIPVEHETILGHLRFENVKFEYPTRPGKRVLSDVSFEASKGQLIALVGASGSGKSTSIGLLERFYEPTKGRILLDGVNISDLNLNQYRSNLALVQQEPMLYAGSISENIMMGVSDRVGVSQRDVEVAAKKANIHDFITSLPEGYNTSVGTKGSMLSGGQKQRIAIARALIRDPRVLLLDEATSALDSESERVVQAALDEAARGRTTIAVAHRLSSIQKADLICVFEGGEIVERGTHHALLSMNGRYADLVRLQSLENH